MKKIFTLIAVALAATSVNAQEESYVAATSAGMASEYKAVIDADGVATNVVNGSSIVKFGTTNVSVEAVGSADPADGASGGQDITPGAKIGDNLYELASINSTKPIKWELKNQGDINFYYVAGTGTPAVSLLCEEIITDDAPTGNYRLVVTAFDPATGGEPQSGLYYKFTTAVDGALKVGIWANKGNRTTFLVDGDSKQPSEYLVEGYINGQNAVDEFGESTGQKKWLTNDEIRALGDESKPWVIGAGNQPFWGNVIIDAKAGKTYWLFQGNSQIGFQGYTFAPGKTKEEMVTDPTGIKEIIAGETVGNGRIFNLAGQEVNKSTKGLLIKNGKKYIK